MNKYVYVLIGIFVFFVAGIAVKKILVESITNSVIERLQKDYSPSPYGPQINPDLLDIQKVQDN